MRLLALAMPVLAVGTAGWLLAPRPAVGFTLTGSSLALDQRDFRVFNNFTDAQANNNLVQHPSFPGYTGAVLAIWKACIEWQSGLHGNGSGDPFDGNLLGSGGANFDPSFQGRASAVGGLNSNVLSEIPGSMPGVFSFTEEANTSDGWRIRFYAEPFIWQDGPGDDGVADLQGIAAFQYGIALGLGLSFAPGNPTMAAGGTSSGVDDRSIENDDRLGIQAIYGVKDPSKPTIAGIVVHSGVLTITGSNFSPAGNTVWFTQLATGGNGEPVKLLGVGSSGGGTKIVVAAPAEAGPGDVLVQRNGSGHADLSNAWPVNPAGGTAGSIQIASATPPSLPVVGVDGQPPISLTGSGFLGVTLVTVGGVRLEGAAFSIVDDTRLDLFEWPQSALGEALVAVSGPTGSDFLAIDVVPNDPPGLQLAGSLSEGALLNTTTGLDLTLGSDHGDLFFLFFSGSDLPSNLPGFFDFGIGNNFSALFGLGNYPMPEEGYVRLELPVFGDLTGVTVHFQCAVVDLSTGSVFPMAMSNVQSGQFAF